MRVGSEEQEATEELMGALVQIHASSPSSDASSCPPQQGRAPSWHPNDTAQSSVGGRSSTPSSQSSSQVASDTLR